MKDIIKKIKAIHERAEGEREVGNEEAAKNHAMVLQKLLQKHRLSMSEVTEFEEVEGPEFGHHRFVWEDHDLQTKKARCPWIETLAGIVSAAHGCRILVQPGSNKIIFFGRRSACVACEYVLVTLVRTAMKISETEYCRFFRKCRDEGHVESARGFRTAWLIGFCHRIKERFDEEARKTETPYAIVLFKNDLSEIDKMFENMPRCRTTTQSASNVYGYQHGRDYADGVNIANNAVEGSEEKSAKNLKK